MGNINKVVQIPSFIKGLARKEIQRGNWPPINSCWSTPWCAVQSHRATEDGWIHWRLSNPTFCPQQGLQEQVAQCPAQLGSEYLQDQRLLSLSGQVVPVLTSKDFFFFLCVQKFLVFWFVLVASGPGTGQPWEKSGSVFFITSWLLSSGIHRHWLVRSPDLSSP